MPERPHIAEAWLRRPARARGAPQLNAMLNIFGLRDPAKSGCDIASTQTLHNYICVGWTMCRFTVWSMRVASVHGHNRVTGLRWSIAHNHRDRRLRNAIACQDPVRSLVASVHVSFARERTEADRATRCRQVATLPDLLCKEGRFQSRPKTNIRQSWSIRSCCQLVQHFSATSEGKPPSMLDMHTTCLPTVVIGIERSLSSCFHSRSVNGAAVPQPSQQSGATMQQ
eukprot:201247-Chlamydomonas_euryale.AAC.2